MQKSMALTKELLSLNSNGDTVNDVVQGSTTLRVVVV